MGLDFDLLRQAFVIFSQNNDDLVTAEVIRQFFAFGKHLSQHGTGQQDPIFLCMGAGPQRGHPVALVTVKGPVDLQRCAQQGFSAFRLRNLVEDGLGFEHAVKIADAGVVAADDHFRASVVLAKYGVQQALTRSGIAHIQRIAALHHVIFNKVICYQCIDAFDPHRSRDVAGLQVAHQRVNVDAVANLYGDLAQVFVRAMHGISQLQGSHFAPALFFENLPGLFRAVVNALVTGGVFTFAEDLDRTGQAKLFLAHHHLDTGVVFFCNLPELISCGGALSHEDFLAFVLFVGLGQLKLFGHLHGRHDLTALRILQGDFAALADFGGFGSAYIQGHRYGPEGAVGQQAAVTYAFPICLGHKAGQRAETTDTDHDQIAFDARGNGDLHQAFGFFELRITLCAFQQAFGQPFSTMRGN